MTRFPAALLVFARILFLWAAFHGAGLLLEKPLRRLSGSLPGPTIVTGMLAFLLLAFPLSLLHLLNARLLACLIAVAGFYGLASLARVAARSLRHDRPGRPDALSVILALLLLILVPSTLFRAAKPQDHSDPLITYAVQPDRWLGEGCITFLEETRFSAMPLLGETLALWPASLAMPGVSGLEGIDSEDAERRTDRLSLLQVFQSSLLAAAVLLASRSMKVGASGTLLSP